jgi:hypothetical protein
MKTYKEFMTERKVNSSSHKKPPNSDPGSVWKDSRGVYLTLGISKYSDQTPWANEPREDEDDEPHVEFVKFKLKGKDLEYENLIGTTWDDMKGPKASGFADQIRREVEANMKNITQRSDFNAKDIQKILKKLR